MAGAKLRQGESDGTQPAARERRGLGYVTRIVRLALPNPQVAAAILAARQAIGADAGG